MTSTDRVTVYVPRHNGIKQSEAIEQARKLVQPKQTTWRQISIDAVPFRRELIHISVTVLIYIVAPDAAAQIKLIPFDALENAKPIDQDVSTWLRSHTVAPLKRKRLTDEMDDFPPHKRLMPRDSSATLTASRTSLGPSINLVPPSPQPTALIKPKRDQFDLVGKEMLFQAIKSVSSRLTWRVVLTQSSRIS
jgi:hypothetical protein